jgi:hypothetical protein
VVDMVVSILHLKFRMRQTGQNSVSSADTLCLL